MIFLFHKKQNNVKSPHHPPKVFEPLPVAAAEVVFFQVYFASMYASKAEFNTWPNLNCLNFKELSIVSIKWTKGVKSVPVKQF